MKSYLIFILFLLGYQLQSQVVDIPDPNFKNALVNFPVADLGNPNHEDVDTNNDGEIQVSEAEAVLALYIDYFDIDSVEGIEYFINMTYLTCDHNNLTEISIDQITGLEYLSCFDNQLSSLDVTQNPDLEWLRCDYNFLTNIDVTQNPGLISLNINFNLLTGLDVSQNPNLRFLDCISNAITALDVSQNPKLEILYCRQNQLTTLDVSQNPLMIQMDCSYNQLTSLDVTQSPDLYWLECNYNSIYSLDLTQNPNLSIVKCTNNALRNLHINNGNNSEISTMFSSDNPDLLCIQVDDESADRPGCNPFEMIGWCVDPWSVYGEECELGVDEAMLNAIIDIVPNPVTDVLQVQNNSTTPINSIRIYDVQGKRIFAKDKPQDQLNIAHLDPGLLFVRINTDKGVVTKKIIKA